MKTLPDPKLVPDRAEQAKVGDRGKALALTALCLALFMATLDDTVLNVALPRIQASLDVPISALQWVPNAYTLPIACLVLPSGTLGDLYGRKRMFLAGLMLFTLASLLSASAPNLPVLLVGRVLQGIGAAAVIPGSLAILVDMFPNSKEQAKAIGVWTAVSGLALLAGPILGGILVDTLGWKSVFLLNLPLGLLTCRLAARHVRLRAQPISRHLDLPGIILSIVLVASLAIAFTEASGWSVWLVGLAGVSFASFLFVESRHPHPMLPLRLFENATFSAVSIVNTLLFFTLVSSIFLFSLFLQQVQGYSAAEAGLRFLPLNGSFVFASLISGWLAAKLGLRFVITTGLVVAGAATLSFVRIGPDAAYAEIAWKLMLSGFGGGLTLSPLAAAAMGAAPASQAGIAAAILNTTTRLGGVFGIALQGTIFAQQLASVLHQQLSVWELPPQLQDRIVADALRNAAAIPQDLPARVALAPVQQAIREAFVSGLHAAASLGGLVLLVGAVLVFWAMSPTPKTSSASSVRESAQ